MEKKSFPLVNKETFELVQWILDPKVIDGALRSAIHAHGWISNGERKIYVLEEDANGFWQIHQVTTCSTSSASKRIRGAIRTRATEYLKKRSQEKPKRFWGRWFQ